MSSSNLIAWMELLRPGGTTKMVQDSTGQEARRMYDEHVKPVEQNHRDEYALVTPDGETFFAPTLVDIFKRAHERSNPGNYIFKVGEVALGKIR
jgi:hypothetical protein